MSIEQVPYGWTGDTDVINALIVFANENELLGASVSALGNTLSVENEGDDEDPYYILTVGGDLVDVVLPYGAQIGVDSYILEANGALTLASDAVNGIRMSDHLSIREGFSVGNGVAGTPVEVEYNTGNINVINGGLAVAGDPIYVPKGAKVATAQTTTSSSYTDLATVGPSVSLDLPSAGVVKVTFGAQMRYTVGTGSQSMALAVSGATTSAAGSAVLQSSAVAGATSITNVSNVVNFRVHTVFVYCNSGTNTFTAKYASGASTTSEFSNRFLTAERIN